MSEQNKNIPKDTSDFTFDFSDFGEPSFETMTAFMESIDALKKLAVDTNELTVIPLDEPGDPQTSGVINNYFVPPNNKPTYEGPRFSAHIYDGTNTEAVAELLAELDSLIYITYSDENKEITYSQRYAQDPTLYIRPKKDRANSPGNAQEAPSDFDKALRARYADRAEARGNGADKPTEGSMKELIGIINSEIAARSGKQESSS